MEPTAEQLAELIAGLRSYGLNVPAEVRTVPMLIIAVKASPKLPKARPRPPVKKVDADSDDSEGELIDGGGRNRLDKDELIFGGPMQFTGPTFELDTGSRLSPADLTPVIAALCSIGLNIPPEVCNLQELLISLRSAPGLRRRKPVERGTEAEGDLFSAAVHEAGHAVVGLFFNYRLSWVRIEPDAICMLRFKPRLPRPRSMTSRAVHRHYLIRFGEARADEEAATMRKDLADVDFKRRIAVLLAGAEAQEQLLGMRQPDWSAPSEEREKSGPVKSDREQIQRLLQARNGEGFLRSRIAEDLAKEAVGQNLNRILELANALMVTKKMSGRAAFETAWSIPLSPCDEPRRRARSLVEVKLDAIAEQQTQYELRPAEQCRRAVVV